MRYRVISAVGRGNTADNSELAAFGVGKFALQILPRRSRVEQVDDLDVPTVGDTLAPVGVEYLRDASRLVGGREAAVTRLLAEQPHNLSTVGIKDDDTDGEAEVFEVLADTEEVRGEVVVEREVLDFTLDSRLLTLDFVLQTRPEADLGIKELAGCQRLVLLDKVDNVEGHLIVAAPRHIAEAIVNDSRHDVNILFEYGGRVDSERGAGFIARQRLYGVEIKTFRASESRAKHV